MRFLVFLAIFLLVLWLLRSPATKRRRRHDDDGAAPKAPERMVVCAHCGVHQPVSESLLVDGRYYCCREHLQDAESRGD